LILPQVFWSYPALVDGYDLRNSGTEAVSIEISYLALYTKLMG
jgi:hypothetical protein